MNCLNLQKNYSPYKLCMCITKENICILFKESTMKVENIQKMDDVSNVFLIYLTPSSYLFSDNLIKKKFISILIASLIGSSEI